MYRNIHFFKLLILGIAVASLSHCSGSDSVIGLVTIAPVQPPVINADVPVPIGGGEIYTLPGPTMRFRFNVNNQGNSKGIVLVTAILKSRSPAGEKTITLDPLVSLLGINPTTGEFSFLSRGYYVEVLPYQASYCMDKVTFLKRADYTESCSVIAADSANTITNDGVSAINTTDSSDSSSCCPQGINSLENTLVIATGLQDLDNGEFPTSPQSYSFSLQIIGYYGSVSYPESNYVQTLTFSSQSL